MTSERSQSSSIKTVLSRLVHLWKKKKKELSEKGRKRGTHNNCALSKSFMEEGEEVYFCAKMLNMRCSGCTRKPSLLVLRHLRKKRSRKIAEKKS